MATHTPTQLPALDRNNADRHLSIHESLGLPGVWQLFRLHDSDDQSDVRPQDVLTALINQSRHSISDSNKCLIPVLSISSDLKTDADDIRRLVAVAQDNDVNVPTVWYQDAASGQCRQPDRGVIH